MCKFQGLMEKEAEFPVVMKKVSVEFPGVLVFGLEILWNFQGWNYAICRISKGKVTNLKISGFFQNYVLNTPPPFPTAWIFSRIAQSVNGDKSYLLVNPSKSVEKPHSHKNQQKTSDLLISRRRKSNQPAQKLPDIRSKIWQKSLIKDRNKIG